MIKLSELKKGMKVIVKPSYGTLSPIKVKITDVSKNIKNGMAGVTYKLKSGEIGWAYIDQIESIVVKTKKDKEES